MTEEEADKEAIVDANNRSVELKKARSMTDDELKVRWHSKYLKMLLASGMMEEEAGKEAIVDANNRNVELKKNKLQLNTYDELKVHWHSKYLKMLLASGMTEEEVNKKATICANNWIVELKRTKRGPSLVKRRPALDIQKCKHCLKLYIMSEQSLDDHLNKDGCNMNGDFSMNLINTDGRIGIYLPEARKVRIAQIHAKRKQDETYN